MAQSPAIALAQEKLAVSAPLSGSVAILGRQVVDGAATALSSRQDNEPFSLVEVDDSCSGEGGTAAARKIIQSGARVAIGFLCLDALRTAAPILAERNIPMLSVSIRADAIQESRNKQDWPFYRLAPTTGQEVEKAVEALSSRWSDRPFALVDDGTIYGRELVAGLRIGMEAAGLEPAYESTYRPGQDRQFGLIRSLERSGANALFIGGDRSDAAIIARNAAASGFDIEIIGGDAMRAADEEIALPKGIGAISLPDPSADPRATGAINAIENAGHAADPYTLLGYAGAQIAMAAMDAARSEGATPADILARSSFDSALGTIRFDAEGARTDNPFRLQFWNGTAFVADEATN